MVELLLADLAELSVTAWLVMMGCTFVTGVMAGVCWQGGRDGRA